jgi:transcriptional regulator with XRE-family HTH domain
MHIFVKSVLRSHEEVRAAMKRKRSLHSRRKERALPQPPKNVIVTKDEVGRRLRDIRKARGVTQVELAKILGIDQSNVSSIERGVRGLTIHQAVKLAKALKVTTDEILLPARNGKHEAHSLTSVKLSRRMQRIAALPEHKQRAVLKVLDALLDQQAGR